MAAQRMRERAARLRDHTPALKVLGQEIDKLTSDAFSKQQELDGDDWPALAESTIEARLRNIGAANKLTKKGVLTKGALRERVKRRAPGGMKMLEITTVMRNSNHAVITGKNELTWSAIGRELPHITGEWGSILSQRPPKRNPTVFDVARDGKPALKPRVAKLLHDYITSYVETGKVAS